jgi:hypothetical protein
MGSERAEGLEELSKSSFRFLIRSLGKSHSFLVLGPRPAFFGQDREGIRNWSPSSFEEEDEGLFSGLLSTEGDPASFFYSSRFL